MGKYIKNVRLVSATDETVQPLLRELDDRLMLFYNGAQDIKGYFERAHAVNEVWRQDSPNWVLRTLVNPGDSVLDLGCGSGHAFENLKDIGIKYTGVDGSRNQVRENALCHSGAASFISSSLYDVPLPDCSFDLVFSLYVLEHLVWPHVFLGEMVRLARNGGLIVIICPLYRKFRRMPSLPFGGGGSLRSKLRTLNLWGAARHLFYRMYWSHKIGRQFLSGRFPWLINLTPSCLYEEWDTDKDAVYFVDGDECVNELGRLGAMDITDYSIAGSRHTLKLDKNTCFIIAEKRGAESRGSLHGH